MMDVKGMRAKLREAVKEAGSQKAWADAHGLTGAYVSDVLAGRRDPGKSIAAAFGYVPVTMYVQRSSQSRQ